MAKTLVAVTMALMLLLTGLLSPCIAAPLVSQTAGSELGQKADNQSNSAAPSPASAAEINKMDETVVGEVVEGITNTQLVVMGLVVVLLIAVVAAS